LALNSKNASKPPSSDGLNKLTPKSLRVAGQKPTGGQKGHPGSTLCQATQPDKIVIHGVSAQCQTCRRSLTFAYVDETRQVFDLPSLRFEVTEHHLSQATVIKAAVASAAILQPTVDAIGQAAVNAAVLHADETELPVAKKLHWLYVLTTDTLTWMGCHPKRGGEAFDALALLQQFKGVLGSMTAGCPTKHCCAYTPCATPTTCAS
jgi:transposase